MPMLFEIKKDGDIIISVIISMINASTDKKTPPSAPIKPTTYKEDNNFLNFIKYLSLRIKEDKIDENNFSLTNQQAGGVSYYSNDGFDAKKVTTVLRKILSKINQSEQEKSTITQEYVNSIVEKATTQFTDSHSGEPVNAPDSAAAKPL